MQWKEGVDDTCCTPAKPAALLLITCLPVLGNTMHLSTSLPPSFISCTYEKAFTPINSYSESPFLPPPFYLIIFNSFLTPYSSLPLPFFSLLLHFCVLSILQSYLYSSSPTIPVLKVSPLHVSFSLHQSLLFPTPLWLRACLPPSIPPLHPPFLLLHNAFSSLSVPVVSVTLVSLSPPPRQPTSPMLRKQSANKMGEKKYFLTK